MIILNFAHPLTPEQVARIEAESGSKAERVIDVPCQVDTDGDFVKQVGEIVDQVGLTPHQWQTVRLVINLPSYNYIAAVLLADVAGRRGELPTIVRLKPVRGSTPTRYEVAELLNLQAIRTQARPKRFSD